MKDRPEPERIEIELTSNADPASSVLGDETIVTGASDDAARPAPDQRDQRRMFEVVAVVGVLALLLGWLIGRSSGGAEIATTDATTPGTTVTTEVVAEPLLPGEPLPSPSTTRPRRTTTTITLAPPAVSRIEIDSRVHGVEVTLVGTDQSASNLEIVDLDLATQTMTRRDAGRRYDAQGLLVGDRWVALISPSGGSLVLVRDGESPERLDLGEAWELLWQPGTDRFWRPDWDHEGYAGWSVFEEVDLTGEPTGAIIELPFDTWVQRVDARGGLIVEVAGKYYSVSESDISLIGVGELIGLSTDIAVMRDCDEQLRCGIFVADRRTGDVRSLELAPPLSDGTRIEPFGWWGPPSFLQHISPDGRLCAATLPSEDGPRLILIDLESGAVTELGEMFWMPGIVWSPDGRFGFFLAGFGGFDGPDFDGVSVYDRESGEVFPLTAEPLNWGALSARPA